MILRALLAIFGRKPLPVPKPSEDGVGKLAQADAERRLKAIDTEIGIFRR